MIYIIGYILIIKCKFYWFIYFLKFKLKYLLTYYLLENSIAKDSNSINNNQDNNNLNIYINNKDDYIKDKLVSYLNKKKSR
jgi:hypothetical protein